MSATSVIYAAQHPQRQTIEHVFSARGGLKDTIETLARLQDHQVAIQNQKGFSHGIKNTIIR